MSDPEPSLAVHAAPWTRGERAALGLFVAIALASLGWLTHPWYEPANDASLYILGARSLLEGEGYSYLGRPFIVRPPGFSVLLTPVLGLFGTDFRALNVFVSLCGIAALAWVFARARERLGALVALALCLALWFNASFQHLCNMVLSDVPGLTALLGCLALERWAARAPHPRRELVLGLAIGLASLVRTVTVLLVPALLAARWCARRATPPAQRRSAWTEFALPALAALLVLGAWGVRDRLQAPEPPVDQNYLYSQWTTLLHVDATDPRSPYRPLAEFVERLPARGAQLLSLLGTRGLEARAGGGSLALGALFLLALAYQAWRRRTSEEFFALLAIGPLLLFQAFLERHVLPVQVFGLVALCATLLELAARFGGQRLGRALLALALAALAVLDHRPREGWELIEERHRAFAAFSAEVAPRLAPDARPASVLGWHYSVHLGRPVWSLLFGRRTRGLAGMQEAIEKYRIDTVILCDYVPFDREVLAELRPLAVSEEHVGNATILRLR